MLKIEAAVAEAEYWVGVSLREAHVFLEAAERMPSLFHGALRRPGDLGYDVSHEVRAP